MPVERIRFIQKIMPDVKLIIILRNPIYRMWAATRRAFAKMPGKRLEDATEEEVMASFRFPPRRENNNFPRILDNWWSVFPREQFCVCFFEEVLYEPQKLLQRIFSFLEVSTDVDWEKFPYKKVINKNPEMPISDKYRVFLEKVYARDIKELHRRFGKPIEPWLAAMTIK